MIVMYMYLFDTIIRQLACVFRLRVFCWLIRFILLFRFVAAK